jgi:hypothetical protein
MQDERVLRVLKGLLRNPQINLGDLTYQVREAEGLGWEGPATLAWSEAVAEAEAILAENGVPPWGKTPAITR